MQASAYTKYVGDLTVYFDAAGNVARWKGAPIFMGPNIQQDKQILDELQPWKRLFDNMTKKIIGHANKTIEGTNCDSSECEMGNMLADIYRQYYLKHNKSLDNSEVVAIINSGGVRASLYQGRTYRKDIHFYESNI